MFEKTNVYWRFSMKIDFEVFNKFHSFNWKWPQLWSNVRKRVCSMSKIKICWSKFFGLYNDQIRKWKSWIFEIFEYEKIIQSKKISNFPSLYRTILEQAFSIKLEIKKFAKYLPNEFDLEILLLLSLIFGDICEF